MGFHIRSCDSATGCIHSNILENRRILVPITVWILGIRCLVAEAHRLGSGSSRISGQDQIFAAIIKCIRLLPCVTIHRHPFIAGRRGQRIRRIGGVQIRICYTVICSCFGEIRVVCSPFTLIFQVHPAIFVISLYGNLIAGDLENSHRQIGGVLIVIRTIVSHIAGIHVSKLQRACQRQALIHIASIFHSCGSRIGNQQGIIALQVHRFSAKIVGIIAGVLVAEHIDNVQPRRTSVVHHIYQVRGIGVRTSPIALHRVVQRIMGKNEDRLLIIFSDLFIEICLH